MYTYYIASSVEKNKSVNFLSGTSQNISILETHEIDRIFVLCDFIFALLNSFKDDCIRATNLTNINTIVVNMLVRRPHNNEFANQESLRRLMLTSSNVCVNQTDAERV